MKIVCIIMSILVLFTIMAVCVMIKFATDVTEEKRDLPVDVARFSNRMGVISLPGNHSVAAERFPYVAAITRNTTSSWSFACFASVILIKWVVTSAHCRKPGSTHRVLLYYDYARNHSQTYPIVFWRKFDDSNRSYAKPTHDIAVAKMSIEMYPFTVKSSSFDEAPAKRLVASVWKTVSTMNRRLFLTNDFEKFDVKIAHESKCFEAFGVALDKSMICVDMSDYEDCFVHEFGPIYEGNKVVGVLAVQPRECDVKLAIFTNVSFYTNWILKATRTTFHG